VEAGSIPVFPQEAFTRKTKAATGFMGQYMTVHDAIAAAERILPGDAAPDNAKDPRWQAIIEIGHFVSAEPEAIWPFVLKWGSYEDEDLRTAIATCLLEHLMEFHFVPSS
jgi:hypothetical protein